MPQAPSVVLRPALSFLLLAAAPAGAQVAEQLDDLRLATAVRLALVADARTRPLDIEVAARGGAVRVAGAEGEPAVADVARRVAGVRSVNGPPSDGPVAGPVEVRRRPAPAAGGAVEPVAGGVVYTVRPGDTLFSLARRYGTTVEAIQRLNGRQTAGLRVGERLRVR